jgi:hypothetical protein
MIVVITAIALTLLVVVMLVLILYGIVRCAEAQDESRDDF